MTKMIPVKLKCKMCNKDLSDPEKIVDGFPGIKLKVVVETGSIEVWLSPLYGSYNVETNMPMQDGSVYLFSCPHCNMIMPEGRTCDKCDAPSILLSLPEDQGFVQLCRRKGCESHYIEFKDFEKMKKFYELHKDYLKSDK